MRIFAVIAAGFTLLCLLAAPQPQSRIQAEVTVQADGTIKPVSPLIHGHHLEHFGRILEGGLLAELLRNQKFHPTDPNRTQVADPWNREADRTSVSYVIDQSHPMVGRASQRVSLFGESREWRGIWQKGFDIDGKLEYLASAWIRSNKDGAPLSFRLETAAGEEVARAETELHLGEWRKYEVTLAPDRDVRNARFRIAFKTPGVYWIDAPSLKRADHVDGLRPDVLEQVKRLGPTILRWPGGGYTDSYDWRKAIGPWHLRPPQDILPFGQPYGYNHGVDPANFGTDEFLRFCELIGAEPYISANFGSGTPEMAAAWVEYVNGPPDSEWGAKRAANGRRKPYGVKYWSIGNEIWGHPFQSGNTTAEGYAELMLPIAKAMKEADPTIKITAVGGRTLQLAEIGGGAPARDPHHWNRTVVRRAGAFIDAVSLHHYFPIGFRPKIFDQRPIAFYQAIVAEPSITERNLEQALQAIDASGPEGRLINVALDEWNTWVWDFDPPVETPERSYVNQFIDLLNISGLEFRQNHRAGLFAARILHVLMRLSDRVPIGVRTHLVNSMAAIRTNSTRSYITASAKAMELYRRHSGDALVRTEQISPVFDVPEYGWEEIPYLDAAATASSDGKTLYVHLINLHPEQTMEVKLRVKGAAVGGAAQLWQIAPQDFLSWNEFEKQTVTIQHRLLEEFVRSGVQNLPPHSISTYELSLQSEAH